MNFKNRASVTATLLPELAESPEPLKNLGKWTAEDQSIKSATIKHISSQKPLYPVCLVSDYRQLLLSWINPRLRITFDIGSRVLGTKSFNKTHPENGAVVLPPNLCVVEIKFNWAIPIWLIEICRELGLNLRRYSKYASSLENLFPQFAERAVRYQEALR